MNPDRIDQAKNASAAGLQWLRVAFDAVATWVTQLSWRKFLLFALLLIICGGLIQETLFSSKAEKSIVVRKKPGMHSRVFRSIDEHQITTDDGTMIRIDSSGLHITNNRKNVPSVGAAKARSDKNGGDNVAEKARAQTRAPGAPDKAFDGTGQDASQAGMAAVVPHVPNVPTVPTAPTVPNVSNVEALPAVPGIPKAPEPPSDLHVYLPPGVGQEVREALADAVDEAASQEVTVAKQESSEWFMNFVLLLVAGLFGTKALMGGKKRAEAQAQVATAAAERATLQREIAEAKMQVMQAQVEPHFLFNTLASVEYLIETDPPRASAMQRSLIQYLRAVLPQMRETTVATTLGREADMVQAYLDLLKMRMEERLTVDFQVPAGLRSAVFPPMMLQSLVENAIKHGLERKPEGGALRVLAEIADNHLRVTVADNGLGFGAVPSDGTGLGLQSIRERLKLLHQDQGHLDIVPNQPTGVRATIDVPYQVASAAGSGAGAGNP